MADEYMSDVANGSPRLCSRLGHPVGAVVLGDVDQWVEVGVGHPGDPTWAVARRCYEGASPWRVWMGASPIVTPRQAVEQVAR